MKPNDIVMYLVDNNVILWINKNIEQPVIEQFSKNVIIKGKIAKPNDFVKQLNNILKKHNLNKRLFNNNTSVINMPNYTQADLNILHDCLEKCNFNEIKVINILNLYKIKRNTVWLIANNTYMIIIYYSANKLKSLFLDYELFKNNISLIIKHIHNFINNKNVILLGHYKDISTFASKIENNSDQKVYYYNDTNSCIIKTYLNTLNN